MSHLGLRQSRAENKQEFMKKMFTFDGWWDQPNQDTLLLLTQINFIERISTLWTEQEEHRPQWEWIYDMKDTQLTFPSEGDDPVWQDVPEDEKIGTEARRQYITDPFSEKDVGICQDCHKYGIWENIRKSNEPDTLSCITGCKRCVEANNFAWGTLKLPPSHPYQEIIDIQCNGVIPMDYFTESKCSETLSVDLIINILADIWDQYTDHEPPKWSVFFEKSPPWLHTILCEILGFIEGPDVAKDYFMEPGQPMIIDEIHYGPPIVWEDDDDDGDDDDGDDGDDDESHGEVNDESEEGLDVMINIIRNLETTDEGFFDDEEEEEEEDVDSVNKVKSAEGLKIIEDIMEGEGQVMNQGKFLELCNIFRDIHQQ